jgi:hypothetical protein
VVNAASVFGLLAALVIGGSSGFVIGVLLGAGPASRRLVEKTEEFDVLIEKTKRSLELSQGIIEEARMRRHVDGIGRREQ